MNESPATNSSRWSSPGAWTVILLAALLVFGPVLAKETPREIGRWYCAAAHEHRAGERFSDALASVNRAIATGGAQHEFLLLRAAIHVDLGDRSSAEADLDAALAAADEREKPSVHVRRAEIHQRLHNWQAAVDDWKAVAGFTERIPGAANRVEFLNNLAYMRALANVELEQALVDVNLAIAQQKVESSQFLDTRGFIHYRLGHFSRALADLDRAVELVREERRITLEALEETLKAYIDQRFAREIRNAIDRNLAVLLYHRGLVQDLFDETKGAADQKEIRGLGFEPGDDLY